MQDDPAGAGSGDDDQAQLDRARRHHRAAHEALLADLAARGRPATCPAGPGCCGCCRGNVVVHPLEAARLGPLLAPAQWVAVEALAARAAAAERAGGDPEEATATARCPLLDATTGACTVYAERPLVCRGYVVVTPPRDCHPELVGPREVATPSLAVGLIGMALSGLPGGVGALQLLPGALLAWRAGQEDHGR